MDEQRAVLVMTFAHVPHVINNGPFVLIFIYYEQLVLYVPVACLLQIYLHPIGVDACPFRTRKTVAPAKAYLCGIFF